MFVHKFSLHYNKVRGPTPGNALIIFNHMLTIPHLLLAIHIPNRYDAVEAYISDNKMDQDSTWGTEVEMFTLAHLLVAVQPLFC